MPLQEIRLAVVVGATVVVIFSYNFGIALMKEYYADIILSCNLVCAMHFNAIFR